MQKMSDKNVIIIILVTILVVFTFIFSVKSPERKIIESPIMWKEDFSSLNIIDNKTLLFKDSYNKKLFN